MEKKEKKVKLSEIANLLNCKLEGEDKEIVGCNTLEEAGPNEITFLSNPKYARFLKTTKAAAVILTEEYKEKVSCSRIISENPYLDFAKVLKIFEPEKFIFKGKSDLAYIHPTANLDDDVIVYPFSFIGPNTTIKKGTVIYTGVYIGKGCYIGEDCILYPNVVIMDDSVLGNGVILHPGVVIGSDGFGYVWNEKKLKHEKIPQIGKVVLEDEVEIGANTTIDRATLGKTIIKKGTKIDNLVQIGHNVEVGENSIIVAQVGIAGSAKIGNNCVIAGQVGIAGHITIGDNVKIGAKAGVNRSIKPNSIVTGAPAIDHKKFLKMTTIMVNLPEIYQRIKELEKKVENITKTQQRGADE